MTIPQDEIEARAARNVAVREMAKAEVARIKREATEKASAVTIAAANAATKRARDEHEAVQHVALQANAEAERREAVVKARQKREAEWAGGLNGVLARHYAGQEAAKANPHDYDRPINHVNDAMRRLVS